MSRAVSIAELATPSVFTADGVNDRVGIGTTQPTAKLDVGGDAHIAGNISVAGTITYDDVTNVDSIGIVTARSGIHVTGGDVGIGTDEPDSGKLHVLGGNIRISGTTENILKIRHGTAGDDSNISQTDDGSLRYRYGPDERLRITSDGSVGIGSTIPTVPLDVAGSARFAGGLINLYGQGYVRSQRVDGSDISINGGSTNAWIVSKDGATTSSIAHDGSATFADNTIQLRDAKTGGNVNAQISVVDTGTAGNSAKLGAYQARGFLNLRRSDSTLTTQYAVQIGSESNATDAVRIGYDGSATFASSASSPSSSHTIAAFNSTTNAGTTSNYFAQNNAGGRLWKGSNGAETSTIWADGSATFASTVVSGSTSSNDGSGGGAGLYSAGAVIASRSGAYVWNGYQVGNSTPTSVINADGSATFGVFDSGVNTNENGVQIDGVVFICRDANTGQVFRVRTPAGEKVSIDADGSATFTGTVTDNTSDRKFKENITDAPTQLTDIDSLQLRTWDWNELAPGSEERNSRHRMGLVAQEAEVIDPNLSYEVSNGEDSYKAIDYKVLTMKLLGAVKELSSKNEALEARIAQLESN